MTVKIGDLVVVEHFHGNENEPTAAIVTGGGGDGSVDVTVFPRGVSTSPVNLVAIAPSDKVDETYLRFHGVGDPDNYVGSTPPATSEAAAPTA
jgi:hypothetical protein